MKQCNHAPSKWEGTVSNESISGEPFASRSVCGREQCIEAAKNWVWKQTHREPVFKPYPKAKDNG